jgi:hypothetical protein
MRYGWRVHGCGAFGMGINGQWRGAGPVGERGHWEGGVEVDESILESVEGGKMWRRCGAEGEVQVWKC